MTRMFEIVNFFLLPSNLVCILALVAVAAVLAGWRRTGFTLGAAAVLLLVLFGWTPVGNAAIAVLENRFPRPDLPEPVTGILQLGGAADIHIAATRREGALNEAGERITETMALALRFPTARVFLSGGAATMEGGAPLGESQVAKDILVSMGLDARRIEMEERSLNTCENAVESARSISPGPKDHWLLVTSASHMPRAVACFRAVGFDVLPYPVDYRTRAGAGLWQPMQSITIGLMASDLAVHEWIGLLAYRLTGRTKEVFPAPAPGNGR
jgi:uncharacterized SAM-binding protein YcdF (DUF218 family)